MALLLVHLVATAVCAGVVWVVQLVVYPSFRLRGGGASWPALHAAHSRAMVLAVGPPWAVQGGTLAALLVRDGPSPLLLLTGALALTTVVVTVAVSVPLHTRLGAGYDPALARRLLDTNWLRVVAWTAAAGVALAMTGLGSRA